MNKIKVSVIIPVYNTKYFLSKCLDSITNQFYDNLEIIIVNDGSTDGSKEIIDNYAEIDKRIIVLHKENGGIGSAYKLAFEVITGDYVLFVDSDDWLDLNAIENILKIAIRNNSDIVYFGAKAYNEVGEIIETLGLNNQDNTVNDNSLILEKQFLEIKHPSLARLFKASIFSNFQIFEQNIGIDEMLLPQLLVKCNRASYTSAKYYNILIRLNSTCRAVYNDKKVFQTIKVYQYLIDFFEKKLPKYKETIKLKYIQVLNGILLGYHKKEYELNSKIVDSIKKDLQKNTLSKIIGGKTVGLTMKQICLIFINTSPLSNVVFKNKKTVI
jgi:glycosyltransferase involved in cell wall biosynthesis